MKNFSFITLLLMVTFGATISPPSVFAEETSSQAQIVESAGDAKIQGLTWKNVNQNVRTEALGEDLKTIVTLEGTFQRDDWTLIGSNRNITRAADGSFSFEAPISRDAMTIDFMAVGPLGEIEKEKIVLLYSGWEAHKTEAAAAPPKRLFVSPGLGLTSLSHQESGVAAYSSINLTAKLAVNYLLFPPKWDLGFSSYVTAFQFSKNQNISAYYIGVNARIGYIVQQIQEPWKFSLYGGWYYLTMIVSGNSFGFKNLQGPQLYPSLRRTFKKGSAVAAYLKFSPITDNFSLLQLNNRELALGAAYIYPLPKGHTISVSADYSSTELSLVSHTIPIAIETNTFTIGTGYGF